MRAHAPCSLQQSMRDSAASSFKRFYGCSFLSDFSLIISSDSLLERQISSVQGPGGSEVGLIEHTSALPSQLPAASTATGAANHASTPGYICTISNKGAPITIPVHGVVLAAASPYFETLLRDWKSSSNSLQMIVSEDQIPAAQVLLSFMYTSTVPAGLSQHDLLQLLLLADRFDVRRAAAAASRVLGCLSPAALEWATLTGIWGLPDHLFEADEQQPLRVVAWDRLMQLFGDLEDSWTAADGRSLWQQLPFRAVTALAASDALAVANENTVFAALSSWIAHAQGSEGNCQDRQLSAHDLKVLAASVRLPSMGPTFLSYVAMQHEWFRQATDTMAMARAAAFAAAGAEVRKDIIAHGAAATSAALAAAAAAALGGTASSAGALASADTSSSCAARSCLCGGSTDFGSGGSSSNTGSSTASTASGQGLSSRCICGLGSSSPEHQAQLLALAQAAFRPRAISCQRSCSFPWHVDLAAIKQLHEEVAAAGSRDSRILRSPAHSFAGYEWALQLEITQTRGATGFDCSKPWALGVFLTCQVRAEVPSRGEQLSAGPAYTETGSGSGSGSSSMCGSSTGGCVAPGGAGAGQVAFSAAGGSAGSKAQDGQAVNVGSSHHHQLQQQPPLGMQLVDFGFVSTAASISVRECGGSKDKRCEKSWEHAVVRYRASWGWPNYLDVQCTGWDESAFERWVADGQMHLLAVVRVLG